MKERRRERLTSFLQDTLPLFFSSELSLPSGILLSITHILVRDSGASATVYVSVFPDTRRTKVAKELKMSENKAAHFVRTRLGSKYSPIINFRVVENKDTVPPLEVE